MQKKLILASASPRRKELLKQAGFSFQILPANANENIQEIQPEEMVKKLSERKAEATMTLLENQKVNPDKNLTENPNPEEVLILGADTIVVQNDKILGKPADREEAAFMMRQLQGNTHSVFTGVTMLWKDETGQPDVSNQWKRITFAEKTEVVFYPMTEKEIQEYVETGEGDDKAGAYGIQGFAMKYIQEIHGDYHNVVGLPVAAIYQVLKKYSLEV